MDDDVENFRETVSNIDLETREVGCARPPRSESFRDGLKIDALDAIQGVSTCCGVAPAQVRVLELCRDEGGGQMKKYSYLPTRPLPSNAHTFDDPIPSVVENEDLDVECVMYGRCKLLDVLHHAAVPNDAEDRTTRVRDGRPDRSREGVAHGADGSITDGRRRRLRSNRINGK